MDSEIIQNILFRMKNYLSEHDLDILHTVLNTTFTEYIRNTQTPLSDSELIASFLSAKNIEGCSEKTLKYYGSTLKNISSSTEISLRMMTTDDIRQYLSNYQKNNNISRTTLDNVRRILSSFYSWLEEEDHILKSPVRRIKKVKIGKTVKDVYSDETLEKMRDGCSKLRDLAMIDILSSTGMRVGELVKLNKDDIDFQNRECIVIGKGNKERIVYFDARTKVHLSNYLNSRDDNCPALFVSLNEPHNRLNISGVETRLRAMGKKLGVGRVHPHKFRRTLATRAIDHGMPIEQVQKLLGHQKIDTTLEYAMVDQNNVKISHKKYIC